MSQEQKDRIIELVEQTAAGLFTGNELISKLEAVTGEKFGTEADLGLASGLIAARAVTGSPPERRPGTFGEPSDGAQGQRQDARYP